MSLCGTRRCAASRVCPGSLLVFLLLPKRAKCFFMMVQSKMPPHRCRVSRSGQVAVRTRSSFPGVIQSPDGPRSAVPHTLPVPSPRTPPGLLAPYLVFPDTWQFARLSNVSPSVLASESINSSQAKCRLHHDSSFRIPFPRLQSSSTHLLNMEEHHPRKGVFITAGTERWQLPQM